MKKPSQRQFAETFNTINLSEQMADRKEFENCEFINCICPDLSNLDLIDCSFNNCNLSNAKMNFCGLQNVEFTDCKLIGADFSPTKDFLFVVMFQNCMMDYTSFDKKNMNKSLFENCRIHGANFTQTDLSKSMIKNCDFYESVFTGTNLSNLDFTSSQNFLIDPESNILKNTKFSKLDLSGLLFRYDIIIE